MKSIIYQRIILILTFVLAIVKTTFPQEECSIQLSAEVHQCSCINNGEIIFKLTKSATCGIDSNDIRYSLFSPANSISSVNSTSPVFNNLPPGEYTGIVSALHHTGEIGPGANVILHDTLHLTLGSSYVEPTMGILSNEFSLSNPFGKVRSLACQATGIVQLKLSGGKMPYFIQVWKLSGGTYLYYKTQTFNNQQHNGSNPAQMDYYDYYNIDSLSAGTYRILFTDDCGYTLPYYEVTVGEVPTLESTSNLSLQAMNNDGSKYNSIYINQFGINGAVGSFAQKADYYALLQRDSNETYWKYRWIDPSVNGHTPDTSAWKTFIFGRLDHDIDKAEKYCDLWGKELKLQVQDVVCHSQKEYTISLQKPSIVFHYSEKTISYPSLSYTYTDSCGRHQFSAQKRQYDYDFYPYNDAHKLFTTNLSGMRNIRYYISDSETDTVIMQGITEKYGDRDLSYQKKFEFDSIYHGKTANFKVLDALGCSIADRSFIISSKIIGTITNPTFNLYGETDSANWCEHSFFSTKINFPLGLSDLDTFQIMDSPGGLSNMTMVYKADIGQWERLDSNKNISISKYFGDWAINGLRSAGTFAYRYKSKCYNISKSALKGSNNTGFGKYYVPGPVSYKIEPSCTGIRIIALSGSYQQHYFDGMTNTPITNHVKAIFRLYGNPGSPDNITGYYQIGDTIDISIEGDIRIEMCDQYNYSNPEHLCHFRDTVIHCAKQQLQYDYFYSYCCEIGDTVSTIRTRAKGGVPPYLYLIRDKHGNLLDSNRVGDFFNVPLPHQDTVSLMVFDQCGTNFLYKGQVIEQQQIKKVWFKDGSDYLVQKDSSLCQLFAIALDDIDYHWHGPGGFSVDEQNPSFFIPVDSNMSGKYYLSIKDSVCGLLRDSLTLKVLTKTYIPELLWVDDSICSGKSYTKYGFNINSSPIDTLRILYDTLVSIMDDSTFLKLTILPVFKQTHIDSMVTSLDTFLYGGLMLSDTGLYEIKFKSACDCDSIVYVHLMFSKYLPCPDAVDFDGNTYTSVRINKYCWMAENLKSVHYSDGRPVAPVYEYVADIHPDKVANVSIFGRLYDWYTAIDTGAHTLPDSNGNLHGICPEGWLLPTEEDFAELCCYTVSQLRSPLYWLSNPGTNESGFSSLPAGYYDAVEKRYSDLLGCTYFWCSSKPDFPIKNLLIILDCMTTQGQCNLCNAYSVRCLRKTD